ncbi:MAG: serine/threonine-protein phosphatase [Eubacterium sp.]|nr:serine/threonine-protein phosphatase [Eubacterium sp.]
MINKKSKKQFVNDNQLPKEDRTIRLDTDEDPELEELGIFDKPLGINIGMSSIIGTRDYQQDSLFADVQNQNCIGIVCDGMGGMADGDKASQTAVCTFVEDYYSLKNHDNIPLFMENEAKKIDELVYEIESEDGEKHGSGTTIVAVIIEDNRMYWMSVGDSRIYIIRGKKILTVNRDHNLRLRLDQKIQDGTITSTEYHREEKNAEALISYLGIGNVSLIDVNREALELREDDIVLLCSDGLYKRLEDEEIAEIVMYEEPDMKRAAKRLTDVVMRRTKRNQDNTSVVLMQYGRY